MSVSAKDKGTGKEQKITIQASGGLSDDEIDKMVKEAEANKESDKQKREAVDVKNQGDTLAHQIDKQLKEHGDKLLAEDKAKVETDVNALKEALKTTDTDAIRNKIKDLTESAMKLGEAVYKEQQEQKPTEEKPKDDNVVDADFEEVKKDK